jgi:DNA polymerase
MNDPTGLKRAARQIVETELLLGGDMIPARRAPLPAAGPRDEDAELTPAAAEMAGAAETAEAETMTSEQKAAALKELEAEARKCLACPLGKTRTQLVFGEGNPAAELLFVGEAPGEDEDRTGRPFVGRAGQKLTEMILAMGLQREDVYICNMLKCRPPGNRAPAPEEIQACWPLLMRQLQIIRPKVIVTLGNPATQNLLGTTMGITRLRGQWQSLPEVAPGLGGIAVMPTFHPSYVIRTYTPEVRKKVWDDLQKVMARLGLKPKSRS